MIISLEDAVGLLSKWKSESTLVAGLLMGDGVSVTFSGVITDLKPHGLVVTQHLGSGQKAVEVLVGFESVSQFEYRDSREAPPNIQEKLGERISSVLMMELPASTLLLFEGPTAVEPGERWWSAPRSHSSRIRPAGTRFTRSPRTVPLKPARRAIALHEKHHPRLSDDAAVRVVVDGKGPMAFDYVEHNARQPNYRHRAGVLRQTRRDV